MKNPPAELLQLLFRPTGNSLLGGLGLMHNGPAPSIAAPRIPDKHHGGVNNGDVASGEVVVEIPVYPGINDGNPLELYLDDTLVAQGTVTDKTQPTHLYIQAADLPTGDNLTIVHYHCWIGFNNRNQQVSFDEPLRIKTTTPGNPPPDPVEPGVNPNLLAPVDVPDTILDPGVITTVPVGIPAYANMAEGDVITVFWDSAQVPHPALTSADVGNTVYIQVPQSIIVARPSAAVAVRYAIDDAVSNHSLFSPSARVNVSPVATLPRPRVSNTVGGVLDVDLLLGNHVVVTVLDDPEIRAGDQVSVHFTGQPANWPHLDYVPPTQTSDGLWEQTFDIPYPVARSLVDTDLATKDLFAYYEVARVGSALRRSHVTEVAVTGIPFALGPPTVPGAPGDLLDPETLSDPFAVIVLANDVFVTGSQVQLEWEGYDGAGTRFRHEQTVDITRPHVDISFQVPLAWAQEIAGGSLTLHYNLIVGDTRPVSYRSDLLLLNLAGQPTLLPLPVFEPPLSADGQLNIDTLTGAFNVLVDIVNPDFVGDELHLHWKGQTASDVLNTSIAGTGPLRTEIPRYLIEPNLDQFVDVWYEATRADGGVGRSENALVSVVNGASQAWPIPEVWDYTNVKVNPLHPIIPSTGEPNTATVVLRDTRLKPGDTLAVVWRLPDGSTLQLAHAPATSGEARVLIPLQIIAASLGKAVEVTNMILVGGTLSGRSPTLRLIVNDLPESELPAPLVPEAIDGVLDLTKLTGDATVWVCRYPFMAVGQTYWLYASGTAESGASMTARLGREPYQVTTADLADGFKVVLSNSWLSGLNNGSTLTLTLKVNFDDRSDEATAQVFPSSVWMVYQTRPLLSENFDEQAEVEIPPGHTVRIPSMTVELIEGEGLTGIFSIHRGGMPVFGMIEGMVLNPGYFLGALNSHRISLRFMSRYKSIRFAISEQVQPAEFVFYDANDQLVDTIYNPSTPGHNAIWLEFTMPPGQFLLRMDIVARNWFRLDTLSFEL